MKGNLLYFLSRGGRYTGSTAFYLRPPPLMWRTMFVFEKNVCGFWWEPSSASDFKIRISRWIWLHHAPFDFNINLLIMDNFSTARIRIHQTLCSKLRRSLRSEYAPRRTFGCEESWDALITLCTSTSLSWLLLLLRSRIQAWCTLIDITLSVKYSNGQLWHTFSWSAKEKSIPNFLTKTIIL